MGECGENEGANHCLPFGYEPAFYAAFVRPLCSSVSRTASGQVIIICCSALLISDKTDKPHDLEHIDFFTSPVPCWFLDRDGSRKARACNQFTRYIRSFPAPKLRYGERLHVSRTVHLVIFSAKYNSCCRYYPHLMSVMQN